MQAGGRRFDPDRLHHPCGLYRSEANSSARAIARRCLSIFVRVNQVLVRLWARPVAMSDRWIPAVRKDGGVKLAAGLMRSGAFVLC